LILPARPCRCRQFYSPPEPLPRRLDGIRRKNAEDIEIGKGDAGDRRPATDDLPHAPGEFYSDGKNFLKISTLDGYVQVLELQMEGKRRMNVRDFLNGYRIGGQ